jgi:alkaline phosphatase
MTGYTDITPDELATVRDHADHYEAGRNLGRILAARNGISWIPRVGQDTKGHTGEDVPLYAVGPGADRFQGVLDNTDIAVRLLEVSDLSVPSPAGGS